MVHSRFGHYFKTDTSNYSNIALGGPDPNYRGHQYVKMTKCNLSIVIIANFKHGKSFKATRVDLWTAPYSDGLIISSRLIDFVLRLVSGGKKVVCDFVGNATLIQHGIL
jgi:hypothetical protein